MHVFLMDMRVHAKCVGIFTLVELLVCELFPYNEQCSHINSLSGCRWLDSRLVLVQGAKVMYISNSLKINNFGIQCKGYFIY